MVYVDFAKESDAKNLNSINSPQLLVFLQTLLVQSGSLQQRHRLGMLLGKNHSNAGGHVYITPAECEMREECIRSRYGTQESEAIIYLVVLLLTSPRSSTAMVIA